MHLDPLLPKLVSVGSLLTVVGAVLRRLRQPLVAGSLAVGVLAGPECFGLLDDAVVIERVGSFGVVLLLFFLGMELSPTELLARWRVAVFGTAIQIGASVGIIALLGLAFDWSSARILVLGFGISLSSTAVVVRILQSRAEQGSRVAGDVTAILLAQDLAIVPMILVLQLVGGEPTSPLRISAQVLGMIAFLATVVFLARRGQRPWKRAAFLRHDHELQVFVALSLCFAMALLTGLLGLSTAAGAFLAGMVVHSLRETDWVERALRPFEVVFVSVFFLSVGMLIDLHFLAEHAVALACLLGVVLVSNTFLNAGLLRVLGTPWREGMYAGAMLSPIGEFSFVLAALGLNAGAITQTGYQLLLAVISLSLLACSPWVALVHRLTRGSEGTGGLEGDARRSGSPG